MKKLDLKTHWNKVYNNANAKELGWYQDYPEPSLRLIEKCDFEKNAVLLNVGVGATTLIDELLKLEYENIIASDISAFSLEILKQRIGSASEKVDWIVDDLTNPKKIIDLKNVDLWHDRALLHFFTDPKDQNTYFNLLKKLIKPKSYVIIAAFNLNGAIKCSGLPVFRYNIEMLKDRLGDDFECIDNFDYNYYNPTGDKKPYIYSLFRRTK